MSNANLSNWTFKLGSAASPQVLTAIEEVTDAAGLGVDNELVEVTNWDSGTSKEYISGLSDGKEFTITANMMSAANGAGQTAAMVAAEAGATRLFELRHTGQSPERTWTGSVVCLGYEVDPQIPSANQLTLTYKITGSLTRSA